MALCCWDISSISLVSFIGWLGVRHPVLAAFVPGIWENDNDGLGMNSMSSWRVGREPTPEARFSKLSNCLTLHSGSSMISSSSSSLGGVV